jgi:outer membrane protein TolC
MKALKLLTLLSIAYSSSLVASEPLEEYISTNKKEQFNYDYEKNSAESSKLRDSWISPINFTYQYSANNKYDKDQKSQTASVALDQTIFQSGGIYYAIKFAQASEKYANYSTDIAKRKLVKDTISLLMQIKQLDLKIQKQKLQIENSKINLELKKEQYLSGQLDSGFLDSAIIERNSVIQVLYDLETSKERLVSKFEALSDADYVKADIPTLKVLSKEEFLEHNIVVKTLQSDIERNSYQSSMTLAKYLPRVSVQAGYTWNKLENQSFSASFAVSDEIKYYNYGLRVNMPLDINSFVDSESAKISYLKSKIVVDDKKRELEALYEQVMQNIANLEKKRTLSIDNRDIYTKLLDDTKKLYDSGYKTGFDIDLLKNSLEMQKIDMALYELDKQLELLTLYEMYKNEI